MNTIADLEITRCMQVNDAPPPKRSRSIRPGAKVNILLVGDDPDKLAGLSSILEPLGENVVKADCGEEALRQLLHQDFALILLDVAMPGLDGFETAALIRSRARCEHVPIIFVTTGNTSEQNMLRGYSLGAVDYIVTPVIPEVLRSKASVFVELYRKSQLVKFQAEQLRLAQAARHQREMAEAADRLEAETKRNRFFTLALDLIGIAGFDGRLLQVNPAWEKVLGYTEAELKSRSGVELAHRDERAHIFQQFEKLKRDNCAVYFEARFQHKYGSWRWLGWTAVPFASEELIYIFARDITARKAAEDEIRHLNGELNRRINDLTEINKELEGFSYSISHDLRAPLRSIASFTQVLRSQYGSTLDNEGQEYLKRVENAARYMDKLLTDLLDYSRLSRSEMELAPVNLESAVSDVLFSIDQEIRTRNATIQVERPLSCVIGHAATVRQIFFNLVINGMKFVRPGEAPRIRIWSEPRGQGIRVWVEDEGIGIAPQFHKKIFGLFQRLHSQNSYPGTGIGLAMVQKGVERMGGRIGVESAVGQGSRFWFELTAAEDNSDGQLDFTTELERMYHH